MVTVDYSLGVEREVQQRESRVFLQRLPKKGEDFFTFKKSRGFLHRLEGKPQKRFLRG